MGYTVRHFSELCGLNGEAFCRQVLVELLHAQEVFCGGDFRFGAKAAWNIDSLREFGSQFGFGVHQVAPVLCGGEKISSTAIRQAVRAGKPEQAANLLGVPYHVSGRVIHGQHWGEPRQSRRSTFPLQQDSWCRGMACMFHGRTPRRAASIPLRILESSPLSAKHSCRRQKRFCCTFPATCTNSPVGWNCCIFCGTSRNSPDVDSLYRQIAQDQKQCQEWLKQHDL